MLILPHHILCLGSLEPLRLRIPARPRPRVCIPEPGEARQRTKSIYSLPLYFNCRRRSSAGAEENKTTWKVCVNVTFLFLHPQHASAQPPDSSTLSLWSATSYIPPAVTLCITLLTVAAGMEALHGSCSDGFMPVSLPHPCLKTGTFFQALIR